MRNSKRWSPGWRRFGIPWRWHRPLRLPIAPRPAPPAEPRPLIGQLRPPPPPRLPAEGDYCAGADAAVSPSRLRGSSGPPSLPPRAAPEESPSPLLECQPKLHPEVQKSLRFLASVSERLSLLFHSHHVRSWMPVLWQRDERGTVSAHIKDCRIG